MVILVRLFGVAIVVMGIMFVVNLDRLKGYFTYWKDKKNLRKGAFLAVGSGVLFLIAAPDCRLPEFFYVLGIWGVIKGVFLLIVKHKKIDAYIDWWLARPKKAMLALTCVMIAFGAALVYFA